MGDTIMGDSNVGKRLQNLKKTEGLQLSYQGKSFPIVSEITIGRDRKNNIRVDDSLASRAHAVVQKIKDAYFIKDLDSTNGTYVNEKAVPKNKFIKLRSGDVVRVGRTELVIG
jgi:pSer/pThr/pTyr-binding forkhead associated (FHA) protein